MLDRPDKMMDQHPRVSPKLPNPHRRVLALLMLLGLLATAMPPMAWSQEPFQATLQFTESHYRIGPGDTLSLHVYNQTDLDQTNILVRDDGMASFNGVGELHVGGKTIRQITAMLQEALGELVLEPRITVSLTQAKPGTVYLAGAVKKPGMYQVTAPPPAADPSSTAAAQAPPPAGTNRSDLRLSSVLANSGGVMMNADIRHIEIKRAETGETQVVDLWPMIAEGAPDADIWLQSGDSVYVPELPAGTVSAAVSETLLRSSIGPTTIPVRVLGEVTLPGSYELGGTSPYLNSAIARAGGYKYGAVQRKVAIRRLNPDHRSFRVLYVDARNTETMLQPNDVVYVPEKKLAMSGRFFQTLSQIFSPTITPFLIFRNNGNN